MPERRPGAMGVAPPTPEFEPTAAACPACGAEPARQRRLATKERATFVRCMACDFEFVNPRPSAAWFGRRYAYYGATLFTVPEKLLSDFAPGRFAMELRLLEGRSGTLLDVGCATGAFVRAALDAGYRAQGIDLAAESTAHGRDVLGLPLEHGDLAARAFPAGSFDVVTLWATLEHLPDPGAFLDEARRILKPGGVIGFSVPNHGALTQRLLGFRNRYVGIDHVNYFTATTAARLCARHGLRVTRTLTDRFNPIVVWQDLRGGTADGANEGASVDRQLSDQRSTDAVKHGTSVKARVLRIGHGAVTGLLRATGFGDLLYVMAERT